MCQTSFNEETLPATQQGGHSGRKPSSSSLNLNQDTAAGCVVARRRRLQSHVDVNNWTKTRQEEEEEKGFGPTRTTGQLRRPLVPKRPSPPERVPNPQPDKAEAVVATAQATTRTSLRETQRCQPHPASQQGSGQGQGWGQDLDESQNQNQNQGTHARGQQLQVQIPQLDVGLGQGEGQAYYATPTISAQPSSEEISYTSPFHQQQAADASNLYYLALLQNQNQLHQEQNYQLDNLGYQSLDYHASCWSPPPLPPASAPPPASPPRPPPRRRFQPTASRRQQSLSHCRSSSSSSRRLLASRSPASQSASATGKTPRQRLDPLPPQNQSQQQASTSTPTPTAHHRHSPFLPPPPPQPLPSAPSSLSACSASQQQPTSSPVSSPVPVPAFSSSSSSSSTSISVPSSSSRRQTPHSVDSSISPQITMSRASRNQHAPTGAGGRQNEYFVPRDGIDREVISADICRYLGNDALVRPGHYENPQTGQVVQGYYITAYRNLTTAMIEDLKADSARWDSERRAQTSRNTSGVQYRHSETHQSRQHHGPTEGPYQTDPYARDSGFDNPRYPGTGAPGYTGAAGSYTQAYGSTSSGAYAGYPTTQQSPPPADTRYGSTPASGSVLNQAYQAAQDSYMTMGANRNQRGYAGDPYANQMATSAAAAQQAVYATAAPTQAGYPASAAPYPYSGQVPPAGASSYATMQPQDPFYGRGAYQRHTHPPTRLESTVTDTRASSSRPIDPTSIRSSPGTTWFLQHPT
ncbi:hypothetical protein NCS57_00444200 [Fusarium keratoplasticum]|uniref:Uncharacterized protein n=1 Tax=Fusarium keratoplasticum TaxID=1328300 RepID=A0ACC0R514_9HYPO|nr:hypothetical protein NCS57_00444200 [Fusarium keratoplasticum]KAI8675430.1 hypothetical protein NCS57_00444200 [Fusarium keratoplasticum]